MKGYDGQGITDDGGQFIGAGLANIQPHETAQFPGSEGMLLTVRQEHLSSVGIAFSAAS